MPDKLLIVGLGNPGQQYKDNRHNVGFQIVDHLAKRHNLSFNRRQNQAFIATGRINGQAVILAKPQTYMNNSGQSVGGLRRFYKLDLDSLLIVFDDIDLPVGTLRLKPSGGSSGQNGMKDIIRHLGTQDFPRLRVGIDRPPGRMSVPDYVLNDFSREQVPILTETYDRAVAAIETWIGEGLELAMSRHNGPVT